MGTFSAHHYQGARLSVFLLGNMARKKTPIEYPAKLENYPAEDHRPKLKHGSTYAERLKDPRWQRRRLEVMNRDGFACRFCGDAETTLNVHHKYYLPKYMPWDYPAESCITLCRCCHEKATREIGDFDVIFKCMVPPLELGIIALNFGAALLSGMPKEIGIVALIQLFKEPDVVLGLVDRARESLPKEVVEKYKGQLDTSSLKSCYSNAQALPQACQSKSKSNSTKD